MAKKTPLIDAIDSSVKTLDILISPLDGRHVETALVRAKGRGVYIRGTMAGARRSGKTLFTRLLQAGVAVSRAPEELAECAGKMLIVDGRRLYMLGLPFPVIGGARGQGFGVVIGDRRIVRQAGRLFEP